MTVKRVAVIGAGPSGLCALRHLAKYPDQFELTAFDKNRETGGLWNYSSDTDIDEYGLPSYASMYKSLRINLPKEQMCYPGYPFPEELKSFVHYTDVKKYLTDFVEHFDLLKYIKFQTYVTNIKPEILDSGDVTWHVTTQDLITNEIQTSLFDYVVICNGTEGLPNWPDYPGEKTFTGTLLHGKNVRDALDYKDKVVLVLGASYSGADLIFEIAPLASKMYFSHRRKTPLEYRLPDNVEEVPCIRELVKDGAILVNGVHVVADVIIYATGYHFNFPFLSEECGIRLKDDRMQPLYRHMYNIKYPSMCFIGVIKQILEFQMANLQAQYASAVLRGIVKLPSEAEMLEDEEADYQARIVADKRHPKMTHDLFGPPQWVYANKMAKEAGIDSITPGNVKLFDYISILYDTDFDNFKDRNFRLIGDDDYEEL